MLLEMEEREGDGAWPPELGSLAGDGGRRGSLVGRRPRDGEEEEGKGEEEKGEER